MIVVGTFIPLPTQLILLPAGYLASQGRLDIITIVIITASGTVIGALINYHLSHFISKKFIAPKKTEKLKKFFGKYGKLSVFLAPLSLGLGQYISIPAGIAKMPLRYFVPIIFISNAIWNIAMVMLGYMFGEDASSKAIYLVGGGAILMIAVISLFVYREFRSY
ncbi:putative integral membrane protein (dedA homolog) [hydrothermal vent metagenome]|uniref:Putative integral membrane protein (DedA homolog) n=1 Tax=hydrothermal vent metagenome TaxID=652676 RepID=A0A1W1BBK9_9ZZZZ